MKILINTNKEIIAYAESMYYAKYNTENEKWEECLKDDSTAVLVVDTNTLIYGEVTIVDIVDAISDFKANKYIYDNDKVIPNPSYVEFVDINSRISALEDVVNILLGV